MFILKESNKSEDEGDELDQEIEKQIEEEEGANPQTENENKLNTEGLFYFILQKRDIQIL